MGKVIFLDVDGTLVDYENQLPGTAVQAVRLARENGHLVYICTGRSKAEVYEPIWEIGLDGMIGGNGSYVEHHGQEIFHQTITQEQCRRIVDWLHARKLEFYLESNEGLFASEDFEERARPVLSEYSKRKGQPVSSSGAVREVFPTMIYGGRLYRDDLNKVSFILSDYQDYLDAKAEFPDLNVGTWGGRGETALFGDFGLKEIDKGRAVEALLRFLHADIEDTVAFGDAKIDVPMLRYCRVGVAMGNGGEEVKAAADYITDDVTEDGLWNGFRHLGLI